MSDENYCIEEDLAESYAREKRLEARIKKLEKMLLMLCKTRHGICLKHDECKCCPVHKLLLEVDK